MKNKTITTENNHSINFGLSGSADGQMILKPNSDAPKNRKKFFVSSGIDPDKIVSCKLSHGTDIQAVSSQNWGETIQEVDGLITSDPNTCLTVTISDCLPIFFYDNKTGVIGITHAGWRGVVVGIASAMIKKMTTEFHSRPEDIHIHIGPHIKKCHFEIGEDTIKNFQKYPQHITRKSNKFFVSLEDIITEQLFASGVSKQNITISGDCTYCNKKYFSYRRDQPAQVVSQLAYIVKKYK